jgi:hypothetical protein
MNQEKITGIATALDEVVSAYENDHKVIFESESARLKGLYKSIANSTKKWRTPKLCAFQGCKEKSIARSHTIQKSGPLALISEDQHVLHPGLGSEGEMQMQRIGLNNASVFPGFCKKHERLFEDFEQKKALTTPRDLILQTFRVVARELFRVNLEIEHLEFIKDEFTKTRDGFISGKMKAVGQDVRINSLNVSGDPLVEMLDRHLLQRRRAASEIKNGIYAEYLDTINTNSTATLIHIKSPDILPVCLSGIGVYHAQLEDGTKVSANIFLCVLPGSNESEVILASKNSERTLLQHYAGNCLNGRLDLLRAIESWMLNQTDHWFITPSEWDKLPENRRSEILNLIANDHTSLGHECSISVLDSTRLKIIQQFESSEEFKNSGKAGIEEIDKEWARLTGVSRGL